MHAEHDRDPICHARFRDALGRHILATVTPALIEQHRQRPLGPHDDALARVLNYFRRAPIVDKYAVFAERDFGPYRVVALPGIRGRRPRFIDEARHADLDAAYHAIFLRRLEDLARAFDGAHQA